MFIILIQLFVVRNVIAEDYDAGYGEDWLLYMDESGETHYIKLNNTLPEPNRAYLFGEIYYYLYSRANENNPEVLEINKDSQYINSSYYDPAKATIIITHGWLSSSSSESVMDSTTAYMENVDYNVIAIDWSEIAANPVYPWAAACTRWVGKNVARLLEALTNSYNVQGDDVHLIGHSLGAQIMGFAGSFAKQNVSRITGLDPARPLFEFPYYDSSYALDSGDADFVDIIHTSAGVLGYEYAHGHADFFPNSGHPPQPGCEGVRAAVDACSHGRSYKYFAESIYDKEPKFKSYYADSWRSFKNSNNSSDTTLMGEYVDKRARGRYYLYTGSQSKYASGDCQSKCDGDCCDN